eukprot:CAMPEP_0198234224 /NCGR_PEP_ID=MMETSP1446-20131203/295_1 /TAXON_ID=1461542 ORGANISM="Unidentified sp, Strain CCMP2111" /NCGR_SAMPLE_ID=MMETSP1446 /ASSEMBLY_ACC=CAM_ASM_001112 /LENGTH=84 /DNA_ID=CAMNT_0043914971 /DNA_START=4 /DNA_END=254 /DNA_ORIENTATION=+
MAANGTEADDTRRELDDMGDPNDVGGINQITGGPALGGGLAIDPSSGDVVATGRKLLDAHEGSQDTMAANATVVGNDTMAANAT